MSLSSTARILGLVVLLTLTLFIATASPVLAMQIFAKASASAGKNSPTRAVTGATAHGE